MLFTSIRGKLGYMFWVFAEQVMSIGVARFLLFPLAAYVVGKEPFGAFVTAHSIVSIIGVTPSMGLSTGLLRHVVECPEEKRARFYQTSLRLCHVAMLLILAAGLVCIAVVGALQLTPVMMLSCLVPLVLSLYADNQLTLTLTELRINRQFQRRVLWAALRAGLGLIGGVGGMLVGGAVGFAWGLAAGTAVTYIVVRRRGGARLREPYDAEMGGILKSVWFYMTLAGVLAFSGQYLVRILVSVWYSFADVAEFYGATNALNLFLVPVSCSGALVLSMLAQHTSVASLSRKAKLQFLSLVVGSAVGLPILIRFGGPPVLRIMFPEFAASSTELLFIILWAAPFSSLTLLMRPFVVKFEAIRAMPLINGVSLAAHLLPSIWLIPPYGVRGAAWAFLVGQTVTGLLWCIIGVRVLLRPVTAGVSVHTSG